MKETKMDHESLVLQLKQIEDFEHLTNFIKESNKIENVFDECEIQYSRKAFNKLKKITLKSILQTHKLIMQNLDPEIAGKIRDKPVWVGGRECSTENIEQELNKLCVFIPVDSLDALEWHIRFETIHPFLDGNGRTGRLIYYSQCQKIGVEPFLFSKYNLKWYYDLFKHV